jgi:hypothetical protein
MPPEAVNKSLRQKVKDDLSFYFKEKNLVENSIYLIPIRNILSFLGFSTAVTPGAISQDHYRENFAAIREVHF